MRKLNGREDANMYFKQVNTIIDEYMIKHRVRPMEISSFIRKNYNRFLKENNLSDIVGIGQIVNDVLDHRVNVERDGVVKFESFSKMSESVISIESSGVEHEKVLADYYNTSLGHVHPIDADNHLYQVEDFGSPILVFIFSDEEVSKIKEKVVESIVNEMESKIVSVSELDGKSMGVSLKLVIGEISDKDKLVKYCEENLSEQKLIHIIKSQLSDLPQLPRKTGFDYISGVGGYHIWEVFQDSY